MKVKYYRNESLCLILTEVFEEGKSEGWSGSIEELEAAKKQLLPFNIHYADDMAGRWELRKLPSVDIEESGKSFLWVDKSGRGFRNTLTIEELIVAFPEEYAGEGDVDDDEPNAFHEFVHDAEVGDEWSNTANKVNRIS